MVEEIFKDIKDLEGKYQVSNFGNILSLNYHRSGKPKLMKLSDNGNGYLKVCLSKDGKQKMFKVHRLVAETFIPNPENLPQVNHIDENKENNRVDNLEWCSLEYNNNYGTRNERIGKTISKLQINEQNKSKKVLQFSLTGEFICEWPSTAECGRNGFNQGHVAACCRGKKPQYKGFRWEYA